MARFHSIKLALIQCFLGARHHSAWYSCNGWPQTASSKSGHVWQTAQQSHCMHGAGRIIVLNRLLPPSKEIESPHVSTSLANRIIAMPLSVTTGSVYCVHRLLLSAVIIYLIEWSSSAFCRSSVLFKKWWVLLPGACLYKLPFLCSFHLLGVHYVSDAVLGAGDIDCKTNFLF